MVSTENLGASGLRAPRLWLGAMMFGNPTSEEEARKIIDAAGEAGAKAIDTSDNYAGGESERIVGRVIAKNRQDWLLATKVANAMGPEPNDRGLSRRWVLQEVDNSLRRLGTDWIDLYYMHRDDETTPIEETLSTFARLIELGKIRYYGLSNFRAWRIARVVETANRMGIPAPVACQPPYSAVTRLIEAELLPCCQHYGLGVVAYSPLARGVLTGKYEQGASPPADSRAGRGDKRILQTEFRSESIDVAKKFKAYAESRGFTSAHFAVAWALRNRLVHSVIGGPRTLEQWRTYLEAAQIELSAEDETFVNELVPPGYASTYGYNDPQYPLTGRVPRPPRI